MKTKAMHVARDSSGGKARICHCTKGKARTTPTANTVGALQIRL